MAKSPVAFAREYTRLLSDINNAPYDERKINLLIDFWPVIEPHINSIAYQSYVDEYCSRLSFLVSENSLYDFNLDELHELSMVVNALTGNEHLDKLKARVVYFKLITMLFYIGDIQNAIKSCYNLLEIGDAGIPEESNLQSVDSFMQLEKLVEYYSDSNKRLGEILGEIHERWKAERECVNNDRAVCLFVEKDGRGDSIRGRMRILKGRVERNDTSNSGDVDTVTFDNQARSPDDPFIGVAYESLQAVRKTLAIQKLSSKKDISYRAYFHIENSDHIFTGDSIGVAMGLISYTQLIKDDIARRERYIANEVALTGGVDNEGNLLPVNEATLAYKLKRAFFSPVKYVLVPDSCLVVARESLAESAKLYPNRQMTLIGCNSLYDVIRDYNILRAEKVCMSRYITRYVVKYSRVTKIQVPLLLLLIYGMLCLIYPKAWVGFDRNPWYVNQLKSGFEVFNADSLRLWSIDYGRDLCWVKELIELDDLDNDSYNEVVVVPNESTAVEDNAHLFVYDSNGNLLFERNCGIEGQYPGDESISPQFVSAYFNVLNLGDRNIILTKAFRSYPARHHLKLWDIDSDSIGWYINAGTTASKSGTIVYDNNKLMMIGDNNRMMRGALFVLLIDSCYGVSPPYEDDYYDLSWVKRGNQLCYIVFPNTDIEELIGSPYNTPVSMTIDKDNTVLVDVCSNSWEMNEHKAVISYWVDSSFRVVGASASDAFKKRRNELVVDGKLEPVELHQYCEELLDSVLYWTDSGWVSEAQLRLAENPQ